MNLAELPTEVLIEYIETSIHGVDEEKLKLLHRNYKHTQLSKELDRLQEEAERVQDNKLAWLKVHMCISEVFDEMSELSKQFS
jgi:hypothetical protein